jgi:hypothetical protein
MLLNMREITRKEAEKYFEEMEVCTSHLKQNQSELRIYFSFTNQKCLLVKYQHQNHKKRFYINP